MGKKLIFRRINYEYKKCYFSYVPRIEYKSLREIIIDDLEGR